MSATMASLATSIWIVAVDNLAFWKTFLGAQDGAGAAALFASIGLFVVLILALATTLRLLATPPVGLFVLPALLVVSAGVAHYLDAWGVLFDKALIRNLVETDVREAKELFTWPALLDVALRGVLPASAIWLVGIRSSSKRKTLGHTALLAVATGGAACILITTGYGILATTFRNHRELRFQLVPSNYINAVYGYLRGNEKPTGALRTIAPDAVRTVASSPRPLVLILVVGETARAANFSLGRYVRDTNSALRDTDVVYFGNVVACGTDTATSLPCMFSDFGAREFSVSKARASENVLDVLQRTGVKVEWLDNNSGCKGVCARIPTQQMPTTGNEELCGDDACYDEILVRRLEERLKSVREDTAIILHQMGSHGPAYYKRYPPPGKYGPTCDTSRIQSCDRQALINTYDNTISYTTEVIMQTISAARVQSARADIAVIYISDHGESLGERNVYLHGLPPPLAPREQLEVPMMAWLSPEIRSRHEMPRNCIAGLANKAYSHDNLPHTLLGMFGVQTTLYRKDLDIFQPARSFSSC